MKIIDEIYKEKEFNFPTFDIYFGGMNGAVFDIETTGLSPKNSAIILSGFVMPQKDGSFLCKQIFAESLDDESAVIEETLKVMENLDYIVTYNGISFDVPFIEKRMNKLGIKDSPMPFNLDIYKIVKKCSDIRKFTPNLRQKTLENYMGLWPNRADLIDGGISVELYASYLIDRDPEKERQILLHNSDDVKQLYRLLEVLKSTDFHKAMCTEGFPCGKTVKVNSISVTKKSLKISGECTNPLLSYKCYDDICGIFADAQRGSFTVDISLIKEGTITFADLDILKAPTNIFTNCGSLVRHYLVLSENDKINFPAAALLGKHLTERIIKNGLR